VKVPVSPPVLSAYFFTHLPLASLGFVLPSRLSPIDLTIVVAYLIGITVFGLRFRKSNAGSGADGRSLRSYFLADQTIPWWAIALSIVSAETSTLTIISVHGVAFAGDMGFLQIVFGYMVGRIVVALLFLPRYFVGNMLTAYQLIDQRFGHTLHQTTSILFLFTRAAAEGVRVFAISIVVGISIGTRDTLSIAIISALTLLYTFEGGMAAVVWTDVVQMAIYIVGTVIAMATLGTHVSGGWATIHHVGAAAGKFHILHFAFNLSESYTFWAGLFGGTFLTMASHGTDQLMVQRMLAARNLRESRLALLSSGVVIFLQFTLFLLIGIGLFVFYGQHPQAFANSVHGPISTDRIFPTFIVQQMPHGVAGLLIAAVLAAAMSNLSAALNALSSTTVVDLWMSWRPFADDTERGRIARGSTVFWALVLFAIAIYAVHAGGKGHVVEIGLSIASVAYGALLGVFLLGTLNPRATQIGAIVGMILGFLTNVTLWQHPGALMLGPIHIPHIAFTWYVLIGSAITFVVGSLASLLFGTNSSRRVPTVLLPFFLVVLLSAAKNPRIASAQTFTSSTPTPSATTEPGATHLGATPSAATHPAATQTSGTQPSSVPHNLPPSSRPERSAVERSLLSANLVRSDPHDPASIQLAASSVAIPDFTPVDRVLTDAIAAQKLPGAVLQVGHGGKIVYEKAFGNRAEDPTLEPMTTNTIFDMASLTKCLATATAVMQLYEAGKFQFDDQLIKYLPNFGDSADPRRAQVTIRMLLTHTSGEAPDVDLKDPWGLAKPDKAEGIHRALTTPLQNTPGTIFRYSDINFILLGDLVESLSGQPLETFAAEHIFRPLGMNQTGFHPFDKTCGPVVRLGANIESGPQPRTYIRMACPPGTWSPLALDPLTAPTAHDSELSAATNPNFDHMLRGTVHDPTVRRMGGVAGQAGVFSTAHDIGLYAQALLDRLAGRPSSFPLKQSTLELMTSPEQPGHTPADLIQIPATTPVTYPSRKGHDVRGFGWDIDTAFSRPRGVVFPIGSFGHTGYTGTTLWMDPGSNTYVVLLSNAVHPRDRRGAISGVRGDVATAVARALNLYPERVTATAAPPPTHAASVQAGIDVLESTNFAALRDAVTRHGGHLRLGLLTNQTGLDHTGRRTVDILQIDAAHAIPGLSLVRLFSPEHGIAGAKDSTDITNSTDAASGLPIHSLYGAKDADRRPRPDDLKDLDAVIIDLQDAGCRFYTYESVLGYFLEALAKTSANASTELIILDRPALTNGFATEGPVSDPGLESYTNYMAIPACHGMTLGELARFFNGEKHLGATLTVVPVTGWHRATFFDETGIPWVNPSPNLRSETAAILYPGFGFLEMTNLSVGRGSTTSFELFGVGVTHSEPAWFQAAIVTGYLNARNIPGVHFQPTTTTIADDLNHYPFHGQTIEAVRPIITDRSSLDASAMGIEILAALHHLYPQQFALAKAAHLVANADTMAALNREDDPRSIVASWKLRLEDFRLRRALYLLYP